MGFLGALYLLVVTFSLLQVGCRAGPVPIQQKSPYNLKHRALAKHDYLGIRQDGSHVSRGTTETSTTAPIPIRLTRRSGPDTGAKTSPSMGVVVGAVVVILLICILVLVVVLICRKRKRQKTVADTETGFGKHSNLSGQEISSPPKVYQSTSHPELTSARPSQMVEHLSPSPPQISVAGAGQQRRIPVPILPSLPMSPGPPLPASPRPLKSPSLPPPPPVPAIRSSRQGVMLEPPLSANGIDRLITHMESEFKGNH